MSCFESSTFFRNSRHLDQRILRQACDRLGWNYQQWGDRLFIRGGQASFGLEEGLVIFRNQVLYEHFNQKNSLNQIETLRQGYQALLVEYAGESLRDAFESEGFTVKPEVAADAVPAAGAPREEDRPGLFRRLFRRGRGPSEDGPVSAGSTAPLDPGTPPLLRRYAATAKSALPGEDEPYTSIAFVVYADGTIISDSNYIPRDVHDRADRAMEKLDHYYGSRRREGIEIKRKTIPEAYREKAFCKPRKKVGEVV